MPTLRLRDAAARLLRPVVATTLAAAALSCGEHEAAGPGIPSPASLAIAPTFESIAAGGPVLVLARVEGWLVPLPAGDSLFASATFDGEAASLEFRPTVLGAEQRFVFRLAAYDAGDELLFASTDTILVRPGANAPVDGVALEYVARDAAVDAFSIQASRLTLALGDTVHLQARACCTGGEQLFPVNAGWLSRVPLVALVDQASGVVSAVAPGRAWIVATLFNGARDSVEVGVGGGVESVAIDSDAPTLSSIGATAPLAATARDATGAPIDAAILWSSLEPAVATVDAGTGLVTAAADGAAAIVAAAGGKADTVVVLVAQVATTIEATAQDDELVAIGRSTTIAAIGRDANGYAVPGLAIGFVPLPALGSGQLALGAPSAGPKSPQAPLTMMVQEEPAATSVVATAVAVGEAWIEAWAWSDDGQSQRVADSVRVVVRQVAATVALTPGALTLYPGDTTTLAVESRDSSGVLIPAPAVSWTSDAPAIADVDGAGLVTVKGTGTATITAAVDGAVGEATVYVLDLPPLSRTWIGGDLAGPGDWMNPANWSPSGAPGAADTVVVPVTPNPPSLWVDAMVGAVSVAAGASLYVDRTLTVGGGASGQMVGPGTVRLVGDATASGGFPSLHVSGVVSAAGDLHVAGDLVVDGSGALLAKGGQIDVDGSALFAGVNVAGTLTAGTLSIGGDFAAKGVDAFRPDPGFLVVLRGDKAPQKVSMDAAGANGQRFADVVLANAAPEGVLFDGVAVAGQLRDDGKLPARLTIDGVPSRVDGAVALAVAGGEIGGAGTLTVLGDLDAPQSVVSVRVLGLGGAKGTTTLGALGAGHELLELLGADQPLRSGLAYRNVRVAGKARLAGPEAVTFDGSLVIEGDAAELAPQGTPLVVTGDLATGKLGLLAMRNDADDVTVKGAVTIDGGPTASALVYGRLRVGGDFLVVCKTAACFQPADNGNFTVELDGVEAQRVALALPGGPGTDNDLQRFRHIRVASAKGVTFETGAAVRGDLMVVPGALATIPAGVWVDVYGTLDVDSSGSDPGRIDNYGELYAGTDQGGGQVKPNPVLSRK